MRWEYVAVAALDLGDITVPKTGKERQHPHNKEGHPHNKEGPRHNIERHPHVKAATTLPVPRLSCPLFLAPSLLCPTKRVYNEASELLNQLSFNLPPPRYPTVATFGLGSE